jgi:hypothetical protein
MPVNVAMPRIGPGVNWLAASPTLKPAWFSQPRRSTIFEQRHHHQPAAEQRVPCREHQADLATIAGQQRRHELEDRQPGRRDAQGQLQRLQAAALGLLRLLRCGPEDQRHQRAECQHVDRRRPERDHEQQHGAATARAFSLRPGVAFWTG